MSGESVQTAAWRAEAAVLLALSAALRRISPTLRIAVGHAIGRLAHRLMGRRRRIALENVRAALGVDDASCRLIVRGCFRHFGRVLAECLALSCYSGSAADSLFEIAGLEHLRAAHREGRGVILFSAHFGNWELAALRQALAGYPVDMIARPLDNPILERSFAGWREQVGNQVIGKRGALRRAVAGLRAGRSLAIVIDQNVHVPPRLFLPFLGRRASVTPTLGHLAVRLGVPVLPVSTWARDDGGYRIVYHPPLVVPRAGSTDERIVAVTRMANRCIEEWIRARPEQWLWLHERWKSQPGPGEEVDA